MVIFSGDASNHPHVQYNYPEYHKFLVWLGNLPIKHKIVIAGNHDSSLEHGAVFKEDFTDKGIIYLLDELIEIEGYKIWGSPYSPTYGDWSFMKARHKLHKTWEKIPNDVDILITHTPPKGTLDLSYDYSHNLEYCGCNALKTRVNSLKDLQLHCFGHIHNGEGVVNAGIFRGQNRNTIFSNGSVVTDGKIGKLSSNGNLITL